MTAKNEPIIRTLTADDQAALERFLLPHIESSMFLLANSRSAGLVDYGDRFQGTYAAAFEEDAIVGVVAHFRNGYLIPQSPVHLDALWRAAVEESGRPIVGTNGPAEQAFAIVDALGLKENDLRMHSRESLYRLDLDRLVVPLALVDGTLQGRPIGADDVDTITAWAVAYMQEALYENDADLLTRARARVDHGIASGTTWLVEEMGRPVAMSSFNAVMAEAVQVGGVYTPPELRGRYYARAAVAQSLLDARANGVRLAVLFTGSDHIAAHRSYSSLGFEIVGEYAIVAFHQPVPI